MPALALGRPVLHCWATVSRRLSSQATAGLAVALLALANVQCGDLLTQPGVADVVVTYAGDTTLVLGRPVVITAAATAGGAAVSNARFSATVSDTSIAAVRGDSLIPKRRGAADLTVSLSSSLLPGVPPSATHRLRVVVDTVVTDSVAITFSSIADTARVVATPLDGNGDPVSTNAHFSSSDTSIAIVNTSGLITARKNGTVTVRAAVDDDTADVAITVAQVLAHYTFGVATITADALGETVNPIAIPHDARGNIILLGGLAPSWSIADPTIGQLSAGTGATTSLRNGSTYLRATRGAVVDSVPFVVDQHAVVVLIYPSPLPTLSSLGQQLQLTARGIDRNGQDVQDAVPSWFTQTPALLSVNSSGLVTTIAVGTGRVLASMDAAVDTAVITISNAPVAIEVRPDTAIALSVGDTLVFRSTVRNGLGDSIAGIVPTWRSTDSTVALVDATGRAITLRTGVARIIAQTGSTADTGVAIVRNEVASVDIVPTGRFLTSLGAVDTPSVGILNARGDSLGRTSVAWTSDDANIVRVSALGVVTAIGVGQAEIRATSGALTDSVLYTVVNNLVPDTVRIIPAQIQFVSLGDTLSPPADIKNALGQPLPRNTVAWTTDDQTVARVSLQGVVTAVAAGQTIVRATYNTLRDSVLVTVIDQTAPDTLRIIPAQVQLTSLTLVDTPAVEIRNALGATLPRNSVGWTTDDATIAGVTLQGVVTAIGSGQTYVRAAYGSIKDSVLYIVSNDPVSLAIVGSDLDTLAKVGQQLTYTADIRNGLGNAISGYPTAWVSSDPAQVSVDTAGGVATATVVNFGTGVKLIANAGPHADTVRIVPNDLRKLLVDNRVTVVGPRVGTGARPYASIQAALNDADALDTVLVRGTRTTPYSENVSLLRRAFLIGDATQYFANGNNPFYLPLISHDTGAAAISIITSAPQTIRFIAVRHTADGPAILSDGADVDIQNVYVNPPGTVTSPIGRGIQITNSASSTVVQNNVVRNVRGYGIKLVNVFNTYVSGDTILGVDSVGGDDGAAVRIVGGGNVQVSYNRFAGHEGPGVSAYGTGSLNVNYQNFNTFGTALLLDSLTAGASIYQDTFRVFGGDAAVRIRHNTNSLFLSNGVFRGGADAFHVEDSRNVYLYGYGGGLDIRGVNTLLRTRNVTSSYVYYLVADSMNTVIQSEGIDTIQFYGDTLRTIRYYCGVMQDSVAAPSQITFSQTSLEDCGYQGSPAFYWYSYVPGGGGLQADASLAFYYSTVTTRTDGAILYYYAAGDITADTTRFVADTALGAGQYPAWTAQYGSFYVYNAKIFRLSRSVVDNFHLGPAISLYAPAQHVYLGGNRIAHNGSGLRVYNYSGADMQCYYYCKDDIFDNDTLGLYYSGTSISSGVQFWLGDGRGPRSGNSLAAGDSAQTFGLTYTAAATPQNPGTSATGLRIVRGNNQTAIVNTLYAKALTVRVVDADGLPVSGVDVTFSGLNGSLSCPLVGFTCSGGGASMTVTSNSSGLAEARYTSGSTGSTLDQVTAVLGIVNVAFTLSTQ
jgi:Big-like domain-containing protein